MTKNDKNSSDPNPLDPALKTAWLHAALTDPVPDGVSECCHCHQWRPEKPPEQANQNEPCPHCGAEWLAFQKNGVRK